MATTPAFTWDSFAGLANAFASWLNSIYEAFSSIILFSSEGMTFSLFDLLIALLLIDVVILILDSFRYGG